MNWVFSFFLQQSCINIKDDILLFDEKKKAKDRALNLLSYRDRSQKEIFDKLKSLNYEEHIVEWVIEELKRIKLIDDARFAVSFAKTKMVRSFGGLYGSFFFSGLTGLYNR